MSKALKLKPTKRPKQPKSYKPLARHKIGSKHKYCRSRTENASIIVIGSLAQKARSDIFKRYGIIITSPVAHLDGSFSVRAVQTVPMLKPPFLTASGFSTRSQAILSMAKAIRKICFIGSNGEVKTREEVYPNA